jgi:hypothetical protein
MFKTRIVECPGCNKPFGEGRSMSQHLTRNALCKSFVNSSLRPSRLSVPFRSPGCHAPIQEMDNGSDIGYPPLGPEDDESSHDSVYAENNDVNNNEMADTQCHDDSNLQDAVSFPVAFTNSAFHEVQLLKLLHDVGAPNYAFQSFMEWGRNCSHDKYNFQPCPQRYESQIRNLTQLVGMQDCRPTTIPVCLEPDNLTLDVVVFPFATMLSSLLNCPILNKLENLVVNPSNRFGRYQSPDGLLDEVNSGQWYQDTYDQTIHDGDKEFLAPIIFTMDKTVISEASHLSVYVILFTTSIFNREVNFLL